MKKLIINILFLFVVNFNVYSQLINGQFLIGGTQEESSSSTIQLSDGDYLFCGTTKSYGNGGQDLLLIRFNPDFSIDWQKTIGGTLNDFLNNMTQAVENLDGSIMVLGNTESYGMGNVDVLLLKISATGNVIWSKIYGGINEERACVIRSTLDGGFIFSGSTDSYNTPTSIVTERDLFLVKLDWLGNVIWANTWGTTDNNDDYASNYSTQIGEIKQLPDSSYLIGGIMEGLGSSAANSFMARINSNGTINWFKKYTSGSSTGHEVINTIVLQNNTNAFANGLTKYGSIGTNGRGLLFNFNINTGNVSWAKNYGNVSSNYNWLFKNYMESSNRFVLSMYENGSGFGDYDISCFAIDSNGVILQQKVFGTPDFDMSVFFTPTIDNGYLFSGVSGTGANEDSYLVKIDNLWSSGCNETNITVSSANITINPQNYNPTIVTSINSSSLSLTSNPLSVDIDTLCIEVQTPCTQGAVTTFQKVIGGSGDERGHAVQQTSDGGYVVVGETTSYGAGNKDLFVLKLDANGNEIWFKTIGGVGDDYGASVCVKETIDNGFIIGGQTTSFGAGSFFDGYLIKLNSLGNLVWDKRFLGASYETIRSVEQLPNGDFIIAGNTQTYSIGNIDFYILRLSSTGTIIWSKTYGGSIQEQATGVVIKGNSIIISGTTNTNSLGSLDGLIIKMDLLGNLIWSKKYGGNAYDYLYNTIFLADNNLLSVGVTESYGAGNKDVLLTKIDTNGNVIWTKTYGLANSDQGIYVQEDINNNIIITSNTASFSGNDILLIKTDNLGNIIYSKKYGDINDDLMPLWGKTFSLTTDNSIIFTGGTKSFGSVGENIYIVKTNPCLDSYCYNQDVLINVSSPNLTYSNEILTLGTGVNSLPANSTITTVSSYTSNFLCVDTVLTILACNLTANFSATNNCIGDSTFFTDLSIDSLGNILNWQWYFGDGDSLIGIQNATHLYASSGAFNVTLVVTNDSNCIDSITQPIIVHPTYNINQNISICSNDSVLLGGNFQNTTGIYIDSLQTIFGCDSVVTTNLTVNPTFSSIQNQIICQGDSVLFGGNYYTTQGIYTDSLQTQLGCDSLLVLNLTVNPSFQINQIQSICQGDSLFLGGSFQNSTGVYTDSLLTVFGCDSLLITNLTVGNNYVDSIAISICQGDSIFLGGSFQNTAGIYTDSLQTIFGCDSIVTTNLIVSPNPIIIASNDTTINACSSAQVSATGGATYSWLPFTDLSCVNCANPIVSPLITTTYIVTGTVNGCSSKDTVIVYVEGESELIIPNVFTPNFDEINDGFNLVGGCIISVDKKIFNRWGQLLFHSNQIEEAWNGRTTAGENVPEGTYFYIFIVNQFENGNEAQKTFKGTLSLLR